MNILQISPAYYPAISIGGPIFSMLALAKLLEESHHVHTLTTQLGLKGVERADVQYETTEHTSPSGGQITYKKYYGYDNWTFSPGTLIWLLRHVRQFDVAILHGTWNFPILAAAWACHQAKVPYVIFPHGTLYRETIEMRSSLVKQAFLKLYVQRMLEQAALIAFTTNDEATKVTRYLGYDMRPYVIPNVIDPADFASLPQRGAFRIRYKIDDGTQLLLHYGRITQKKGIDLAIKATAALRNQGRNVALAVVGGDDEGYRASLSPLIAELRIENAVIFSGLLSREESKTALADADIFVLPSHSENFGMSVVESMLCRLPVVISNNVGLAEELARADVAVVTVLDSGARNLTQVLSGILDDTDRRESLAARGREFAIANYSPMAVKERLEELLRQATKGTRQQSA